MNDSTRYLLISGSLFAALAVMLGAFGAHGLKKVLTEEMLVVYHTAVDYHFIHALGILLVGLLHHLVALAGREGIVARTGTTMSLFHVAIRYAESTLANYHEHVALSLGAWFDNNGASRP